MEFSQEQLERLLTDAKVRPSKEKLAAYDDMQAWRLAATQQMAVSLPDIARLHRSRRVKLPEKDTRDRLRKIKDSLDNALQEFEAGPLPLLGYKAKQQIEAVRSPRNDVEQTFLFFESLQCWYHIYDIKLHIPTYFYLDFFWLYSKLTGKTGLGAADGNGPLYEFTKKCAALADPELQFPNPGAFRKLMTKNKDRRRCVTLKGLAPLRVTCVTPSRQK